MKRVLLTAALCLCVSPVFAAPRCPLDVSNPAITHTAIPIHGGLQGVTAYANPSEWPFFSHQHHWATGDIEFMGDFNIGSGMTADFTSGDTSLVLLRGDLGHVHIEECLPYLGEITGPITIPFRVQIFHNSGVLFGLFGDMVRDVVWDAARTPLDGNPMGVVIATGHYTLDPFIGTFGAPNIHGAAIHGWTNFESCIQFRLTNFDVIDGCGLMPIYTLLSESWPEQTDFTPSLATHTSVVSVRDQALGESRWGKAVISVDEPIPVLKPFTFRWTVPTMSGYSYGAVGQLLSGLVEMRKNMDLHNGDAGTSLNATGDYFDPVEIGVGPQKVAMIWQTQSGPSGIPGFAIPNESLASLLIVNVEAGAPDPTRCNIQAATNVGALLPCVYPPPQPGIPVVTLTVVKHAGSYHLTAMSSDTQGVVASNVYLDGQFYNSNALGNWSIDIPADTSIPHAFWVTAKNAGGKWSIAVDTK
jgi:hypothetical protein